MKWDRFILNRDKEELVFIDNRGDEHLYKRKTVQEEKTQEIDYDQLVFYIPAYWDGGPIPQLFISIDNAGKITAPNDLFPQVQTYQLTSKELKRLNKLLLDIKVDSLFNKGFDAEKTYGIKSPFEISIVKDNMIETTQDILNHPLSRELYTFIANVFTYRRLPIKTIINKDAVFDHAPYYNYFLYFRKNTDRSQCAYLTYSQANYLWMQLLNAKATNQSFSENYVLDNSYYKYNLPEDELIHTDGRYYRYKGQALDLGYNFLIKNNLINSFVDKKEIDGQIVFERNLDFLKEKI